MSTLFFFSLVLVEKAYATNPDVTGSVLLQDTFTRSNVANGWGTATDGNAWTLQSGTAANVSVNANEGRVINSGASQLLTLGSTSISTADSLVRYESNQIVTDGGRIMLRFTDINNTYAAGFGANGATGEVDILKTQAGVSTKPFSTTVALSEANNTFYWIRFNVATSGSNAILSIKVWQDGTAEPASWTGQVTDTSPLAAGKAGIKGFAGSTGWVIDNFSVGDNVVSTPTPTSTAAPTSTPTPTPTPTAAPGLVVTSQTQSGISGGFSNNQAETDIHWTNSSGDGWQVGLIPTYGGAIISPWYEIASNTTSINQTSLATTIPDGFIHWLTNRSGTYLGTESSAYTLAEQTPTGTGFRRYYSGTVPTSGTDANGFNYLVKTAIYPGNPGFIADRVDATNPSGSAITLGAADSLEVTLIGGLQEVGENVWDFSNGGYGTVGGSNTVGWPTLTSTNPDYVYITPKNASGISTGVETVIKTKLTSNGGSSNVVDYDQNTSRLKVYEYATIANFSALTTKTFYYLQVLDKNLTSGDAISIAADYLNPDTSGIMTTGSMSSFSYDEAAYQMTASGNEVLFTPTITGNVTERWINIYKIANYTSLVDPTVKIGSTSLTKNTDYLTYVDTGNQIAYVKLMKPLVASGASASQFNNGAIDIFVAIAPTATPTPTSASSSNSSSSDTTTPSCGNPSPGAKAPWLYAANAQDSQNILLYFASADGPLDHYILQYGTTSGNYPYGSQNIGGSGARTALVSSLAANTTYYFRIQAANGCAPGTWSNEISATTNGNNLFGSSTPFVSTTVQPVANIPLGNSTSYKVQPGDSLWSIASFVIQTNDLQITIPEEIAQIIKDNQDEYPSLSSSANLNIGWDLKIQSASDQMSPSSSTGNSSNQVLVHDVNIKVTDTNKQPVAGAMVTLHSTPQTTTTDKNGVATFHNVESGNHQLLIAYGNFKGEESLNLTGSEKEFSVNVVVKPTNSFSPLVIGVTGVMALIIIVLSVVLIRTKKTVNSQLPTPISKSI